MAMLVDECRSSKGRSRGPEVQTMSAALHPSPWSKSFAWGVFDASNSTAIFAKIPGRLKPYNISIAVAQKSLQPLQQFN